MIKLNLSNEAANFLNTLDRRQVKPLWERIAQLIDGSQPGDVGDFGDGKLYTLVNEFLIVLKFDDETVYIDFIGRRSDPVMPPEEAIAYQHTKLGSNIIDGPILDTNSIELFTLSALCAFFVFIIGRWFILDLIVFGALDGIPFLACLAGTAVGIWHKSDRLYKFTPISLLITVLLALFFKYVGNGSHLMIQSLAQYNAGVAFNPADSVLAGMVIITAIVILLSGPFSFVAGIGSRIGTLFTDSNPLAGYGTITAALLFGYVSFELSTALCAKPSYQIAAVATVLLIVAGRTFKHRLLAGICLTLAIVAILTPLSRIDSNFSHIDYSSGRLNALWLALIFNLVAIVTWLSRAYIISKSNFNAHWQLLLLGAALSNLVLGSLPRLETIFGSGCLTSITTFSGLITLAWLANLSIRRSGAVKYELILYIGLFVTIVLSYFLPVQWLHSWGIPGDLLITIFTIIPIVRVLLMLPGAFSTAQEPASMLAFSLIGLASGLLFKGIAVYFGQNFLLLVSLILLGLSFFFCMKDQKGFISPAARLATKRVTQLE